MICRQCKNNIHLFYKFKQKCLSVDMELKKKSNNFLLGSDFENANKKQMKCMVPDTLENVPDIKCELPIEVFENVSDVEFPDTLKNGFKIYIDDCHKDNIDPKLSEVGVIVSHGIGPHETTMINIKSNNNDGILLEHESHLNITQCELCGSFFNTKAEFKRHLTTHGEKKLYQCKFCPKRFTRAETNINHIRSHLGIKPFICEVCGQSSTKYQDLVRHMKVHSDEKNHACPNCGRRFKRSSDLSSHIRTHTGARPYKCRVCEKDYTSHGGLRKHYKTHEIK